MNFSCNKTTTGPLMSNMKLADMLQNRHAMSLTVRKEVSPLSQEWGYSLGSVYNRKVHFRDEGMVKQIEEKVVNRLRQLPARRNSRPPSSLPKPPPCARRLWGWR